MNSNNILSCLTILNLNFYIYFYSGTQLATRTIDLFIRHVCLLAPLHLEATRSQILTDLNQLEIALTPVCPVLSELGKPYKLLKGFKTLLGQKIEEIVESSIVGTAVSYSTSIHLLFRFSREEMKMPHSVNGWSITRYSKWLDEHPSETDRLNLLKAALESYVHTVRAKGQQKYCSAYPHMMTLLQKGLALQWFYLLLESGVFLFIKLYCEITKKRILNKYLFDVSIKNHALL